MCAERPVRNFRYGLQPLGAVGDKTKQFFANSILCAARRSGFFRLRCWLCCPTSLHRIQSCRADRFLNCLLWTGDLFGNCFGGLSFLIIRSISVDRFLALYFRQRYRVVVTRKRTLVLTLVLSLIAAAYGLTGIHNRKAYYVLGIILGPLFLVLTSLNYININRLIRRHNQRRFRLTSQQSSQSYGKVKHELDMARYKHTLKIVMYVFFVFLLCYLPYISCTLAKLIVKTRSAAIQISVHATVTVIFINSSLNPALYCWRVPEIRKAVRQILRLDKQLVVNSSDATQQLKTCTEVKAESGPVYIINCSKTIVGISTVSLKE